MTSDIKKTPEKSPPRRPLGLAQGVVTATDKEYAINPEKPTNKRTIELATDQSIAARNLLYNPNASSLAVISKCAAGINAVMHRLKHTDDVQDNLKKDKILISMCTRLMADGGAGRIPTFNTRLADLVNMQNLNPKPDNYAKSVSSLAQECRNNMAKITATAVNFGHEGACARQGMLAFLGDLGGIEKHETGFGSAYKGPLCDPKEIYMTYVAGLCDAQRTLTNQKIPASHDAIVSFEKALEESRKNTSIKGGSLSAPVHTAGKKIQRAPLSFKVEERKGLLNTGDMAEEKLKTVFSEHHKSLVDVAWPSYLVSKEVVEDVAEPVTGHISGTFGEMVTTMNLFCGTTPNTITWETPSGAGAENSDQTVSIAALAAAGLISAGFHSAVEIYQPMSTFTTHATQESIGPKAVAMMNKHVKALRAYANEEGNVMDKRATEWVHDGYALDDIELNLSREELLSKAESLENAATKSVDMISMLQGGGGSIATLEVSRVMASQSSYPKIPFKLYSVQTQLDELGLRAHTSELEKARTLAKLSASKEQQINLERAISDAELAADQRDLLHQAIVQADLKVQRAEAVLLQKQKNLSVTTKATEAAQRLGWGEKSSLPEKALQARQNIDLLENTRKQAFRENETAKSELVILKLEATSAKKEATAAKKEGIAQIAETTAAKQEQIAQQAEQKVVMTEQTLIVKTQATDVALRRGWEPERSSPKEALNAQQKIDELEESRRQAFKENIAAKKEAMIARKTANNAKNLAANLRSEATQAKEEAAEATKQIITAKSGTINMMEKCKITKQIVQNIKENTECKPANGSAPKP